MTNIEDKVAAAIERVTAMSKEELAHEFSRFGYTPIPLDEPVQHQPKEQSE